MTTQEAKDELRAIQQAIQILDANGVGLENLAVVRLTKWESELIKHINR